MSDTSTQDLSLWRQWDAGGRKPDDMEPLLDKFAPLIESHYRRYAGHVNIPDVAIRADLENRFAQAVKTYDPTKGTQLSTHVWGNLKGVHRFVVQQQNMSRIPENQASRIAQMTAAVHTLQEDFGRVPDNAVLASYMNWSPTQVMRLRKSMRKDLSSTQFLVPVGAVMPSRWEAIKALLPTELTPKQQFVFKHTTGAGGAPILQAQAIAKKLHMSNASVSRARAEIAGILERYGVLTQAPNAPSDPGTEVD
jgi:hypothetical protein